MNKEREALEAMYGVIESGWTQFALARNKEGYHVGAADESAVRWCISGAYVRNYILRRDLCEALDRGLHRISDKIVTDKTIGGVADWNDSPGRTKDDALKLIRECIMECQ